MLEPPDEPEPLLKSVLAASHTPQHIRLRLESPASHSYLKDFVYGAIDGTVTTFAVVSGIAGAELSTSIIVVLGMANLIGDGFSMAASNYLGTKTEEEMRKKARQTEEKHILHYPEGEREEVRQIFAAKGFEGEELERVVEVITSDHKRWVDTMIVEELRMTLEGPSAIRAAATTLLAFVAVGLIPLSVFIFNSLTEAEIQYAYFVSMLLTGVAFFLVGAAKSRFIDQSWGWSGTETLCVGSVAAGLAYLIGYLLSGLA